MMDTAGNKTLRYETSKGARRRRGPPPDIENTYSMERNYTKYVHRYRKRTSENSGATTMDSRIGGISGTGKGWPDTAEEAVFSVVCCLHDGDNDDDDDNGNREANNKSHLWDTRAISG